MSTITAPPTAATGTRRTPTDRGACSVEATYAPCPHAAQQARKLMASALANWPTEAQADAALVLTELVSNAAQHAHTDDIELKLTIVDTRVRIEVTDDDVEHMPSDQDAATQDEHGRGSLIVDCLSDHHGCYVHDRRKTVWADVACTC